MQLAIAKCLVNQRLMDESALFNYAISDPEVRKLKLHTQLEMCKLEDLFHHFKKQKIDNYFLYFENTIFCNGLFKPASSKSLFREQISY